MTVAMLNLVKQARSAVSLLKPEEVRHRAGRPVHFGLVAADDRGYQEMEEFLIPADLPPESHHELSGLVHRASDPDVPSDVDLVLFGQGISAPKGSYTFDSSDTGAMVAEILRWNEDLALALARRFPAFRKSVVEQIIHAVARENAIFAITTALPDIIPSLAELPWAVGEFASDTAFLTGNQVRMAFQIAAACGKEIGFGQQKGEILTIVAGAFGWRALARELVGKIPLGGGIIPKGAIAYAGTLLVGKGLEHFHHAGAEYTRAEREALYQQALERGKAVAESVFAKTPFVGAKS
jgi:hypothetical protein